MTEKPAQPQKSETKSPKDDPMQAELADMRAQLDALKASREAAKESAAATELAKRGDAQTDELDKVKAAAGDLSTQLKQLLEGFDEELKDTKPTTLLAVFGAGVVVGRLLAK
jgi:multidrug resistance efflux pump